MRVGTSDILFVNQFLKILVRARKANVSTFKYQSRTNVVAVAEILAKNHLIFSYGCDVKLITVALHRNVSPLPFSKIDLLSTPGKQNPMSLNQIKTLQANNPFSFYIVSTPYGYLSSHEAIARRTGGVTLAKIGY